MKIPIIIICAVLLFCFLPASGLDLSQYPDLQAKYPNLGSATPVTTFDELKNNFAGRTTSPDVLLQRILTVPDTMERPVLPGIEQGNGAMVTVPGGSYSDRITERLQDLGNGYTGQARSLLDNYTKYTGKKTIPDKPAPGKVPATSDTGKKVVEANNQFALDLYSSLAAENPEGNLFFSPWSISSALAISYEGAGSTTADEIQSVFHFPEDDFTRWNGYKEITDGLNNGNSGFTLETANALWAEETYPFLPSYLTTADRYYSAHATNLDFVDNPEGSRETINRWVEDNTGNRIRNLLPYGSIDSETRLVITNAIYFKGSWATPFKKENTAEDDFRITPAMTVRVPMMKRTDAGANYWYTETDTLQVLGMPYSRQAGRELSMLVLLPKGEDLSAVEQALDDGELAELRESLVPMQVMVYFPKFRLETDYRLKDALGEMGMPSAFVPGDADFSGMDGTRSLYILDVFHKAYVDVNEEGTEAAAATAVPHSMGASDPGIITVPTFRADHPFIFIIQDSENGNILFLGRVEDPRGGMNA
jgi:serpin B